MDRSSPPTASHRAQRFDSCDFSRQVMIACGVETRVVLRCPSEGGRGLGVEFCGIEGPEGLENRR